ncbi:helix-turn-helix domain-containing protein [Pseudoxanthomonas sp. F37]|uniref:helix-turn-helix domain-containing protein n=1 Tax=Pseudoxanthomonas sp. F37 TaxID=2932492 RepID=UPI001FD65B4B|nr:helix-turn-helix transcriptional regulator [Pseudoxanthomonas sp. F37]UOV10606.1 helix-turn-helix domain-containing protein [Pseudoxanthomonas sp. F37]
MSASKQSTFAQRLKQARLHVGLSQKELGIQAGLDPQVASPRINQYERGKHEPKLETAERLAQALGIPAAFLYAEDELLAKVLLRWNTLSKQQKRELVRLIEAAPEK